MKTLKTIKIFCGLKIKELWEMGSYKCFLITLLGLTILEVASHIPPIHSLWASAKHPLERLLVRWFLAVTVSTIAAMLIFLLWLAISVVIRQILYSFIPWIKSNWEKAKKLAENKEQ